MNLHSARTEVALSMKEMLKQKIENWKNLPQPSSSASACLEYEELESSKLLPPQLLTSIKRQDLFSLFWEIEKMIEEEGVHISVIANQSSRAGNTMLHIAAMYERQDILEVICEHFPHLMKKQNIKGDTVVHIIGRNAGKKNVMMRSVIEWYERHLEDDEEDNKVWRMENIHGNTALHEAVMACNVEGVKMLYREDGGVTHLMNKEGKSALYLGVETGNYDIINVLMEAPFFNRRIHQGTSPLHAAIFARSSGEITKYSVSQPLVKSWLVDTVSIRIRVAPHSGQIIQYQGERTSRKRRIWGRPIKMTISRSGMIISSISCIMVSSFSAIIKIDLDSLCNFCKTPCLS